MIEDFDKDIELIKEIPDEEVEWIEEFVDVYTVKGQDFLFTDLVEDFIEFYRYMFLFLGFGEPTEAQLEMAKYVSGNKRSFKMLLALRGLAKSLTLQLFVLWRLLRNNDEHILIRSASTKRSRNFTTFLLNLIKTTPILQHMAPRSNQRKSAELFDVNGAAASDSPSVYSAGVTSQITGMRATIVVSDDVEVPENSRTPEARELLFEQVNESVNLLVESEEISGEVIILGTYQSMDSIYLKLEETGAYEIMVIPAEYPEINEFYDGRIAEFIEKRIRENPSIIGTAVDTRFNMEVLNRRRAMVGKSQYQLQYMLNPSSSDDLKYPLKLRDLIVHDVDLEDNPIRFIYSSEEKVNKREIRHNGFTNDYLVNASWTSEERLPFDFILMAVDPSGRGTDETSYVVLGFLSGKIFIIDLAGLSGGYDDDALDTIVSIAKKYDINKMIVEDNFGDGAITKMIETKLLKVHNCEIEGERAILNKEARIIDTLEPLMNQHRIIINRQVLLKDMDNKSIYSFTYQLTHISKIKSSLTHDDKIDVLELGVRTLIEFTAQDDSVSYRKHKERTIEQLQNEMLRDAMKLPQIFGNRSSNFGVKY